MEAPDIAIIVLSLALVAAVVAPMVARKQPNRPAGAFDSADDSSILLLTDCDAPSADSGCSDGGGSDGGCGGGDG